MVKKKEAKNNWDVSLMAEPYLGISSPNKVLIVGGSCSAQSTEHCIFTDDNVFLRYRVWREDVALVTFSNQGWIDRHRKSWVEAEILGFIPEVFTTTHASFLICFHYRKVTCYFSPVEFWINVVLQPNYRHLNKGKVCRLEWRHADVTVSQRMKLRMTLYFSVLLHPGVCTISDTLICSIAVITSLQYFARRVRNPCMFSRRMEVIVHYYW